MTKRLWIANMCAVLAMATGCASMSGLDATNNFSCKAAPGVTCQSVSGVHQNAMAGNLPFQRTQASREYEDEPPAYGSEQKPEASGKVSPRDMVALTSGMPIRQPPLVLRVWLAPYEDDQGDLHDQAYFYTMVHSGRWLVEANRKAISNQFRPVYPLTPKAAAEETNGQRKKDEAPRTWQPNPAGEQESAPTGSPQ